MFSKCVCNWKGDKLFLIISNKYRLPDAAAADYFFVNIVAKGEIAHDEQFVFLSQCFQLDVMMNLLIIEVCHSFYPFPSAEDNI